MTHNINDIRSRLVRGGARPTQFLVHITNPIDGAADLDAPFMIKAAQFPQLNVTEIPISYFGRQFYVPGDRIYDPWNVSVINDENFKVRNALEAWNSAASSLLGNLATDGSEPSNYKSQATVTQYGKNGEEMRIYQFNGLWPTLIAPIDLNWEQQNTIEEFQVTFRFDDFEVVGGNSPNTLRL